jgi:hypothetical protein
LVKKNGFFGPEVTFIPEKRVRLRDFGRNLMEMNGRPERFPAKWGPVRVKKTRQIKI